ncbi:replication-relaxation family protein [Listeria grayi]|uniref:replication-relaxation family protein n=1 Tax=Listeria grayi TaxID=1641 RepID=UPI001624DD6C|nr:replication-relaxation family protein [Listeria grayi]MBC1922982.1 hypothetical protein [Listeria grayi]
MSYQKLINHYYIDPANNNANYIKVLTLINELRVITKNQIKAFFASDGELSKRTYDKVVSFLEENGFIERIMDYRHEKSVIYYITHEGVSFLGSAYTVTKNPKYNLEHHLMINDKLIESITVLGSHPHLNSIASERRLVFEAKDCTESKGRIYKVPDFCFEFLDSKQNMDISWHFEIELTLKSYNRYQKKILPHYIRLLEDEYTKQDKIIYVVPTDSIQNKLEVMVEEIEYQKNKSYDNLIIVPFENFSTKLLELSQDLN